METVTELKARLAKAEAEEAKNKLEDRINTVKSLVGKVFKTEFADAYSDRVNSNHIKYIKILGWHQVYDVKEPVRLKVQSLDIVISPVGWTRKEKGRISFKNVANNFKTYRKQEIIRTEAITTGKMYDFDAVNFIELSNGYLHTGYTNTITNSWKQCTEKEMNLASSKCSEWASKFYSEMSVFVQNDNLFTEESEGIIRDFDDAALQRLSVLANTLDKVSLKTLVDSISGKVTKYNFFNRDYSLGELAQYNRLGGDKGLNLSIEGGDDGTDYEPYVTRFYISNISIDWAYILYPIRTSLNCKVFDLVEKLSNIKEVYNVSNWECNYDTSTYDAKFTSAKLKKDILEKVNKTIKAHTGKENARSKVNQWCDSEAKKFMRNEKL